MSMFTGTTQPPFLLRARYGHGWTCTSSSACSRLSLPGPECARQTVWTWKTYKLLLLLLLSVSPTYRIEPSRTSHSFGLPRSHHGPAPGTSSGLKDCKLAKFKDISSHHLGCCSLTRGCFWALTCHNHHYVPQVWWPTNPTGEKPQGGYGDLR